MFIPVLLRRAFGMLIYADPSDAGSKNDQILENIVFMIIYKFIMQLFCKPHPSKLASPNRGGKVEQPSCLPFARRQAGEQGRIKVG